MIGPPTLAFIECTEYENGAVRISADSIEAIRVAKGKPGTEVMLTSGNSIIINEAIESIGAVIDAAWAAYTAVPANVTDPPTGAWGSDVATPVGRDL